MNIKFSDNLLSLYKYYFDLNFSHFNILKFIWTYKV